MAAIDLNLIAQFSAEGIAECLVEGALVAGLAAVAMRFARRQRAAMRFAIWLSVLMTIALVPLATGIWRSTASSVGGGRPAPALVTVPESWAPYIFVSWAAMAAIGLFRIAVGLWQVYRLRRSCVEAPAEVINQLQDLPQLVRGKTVRLCVSDQVQAPAALGFLHPAVVLPGWLLSDLSSSQLRQVVIHELTHLQRRDDWTNLAQKVVAALLFFHPLVWWIQRRLALEREMACDDAVLVQAGDARGYAECLVRLAETSLVRRGLALAQAAVSGLRHTSVRVAHILDGQPRIGRSWRPAMAAVVVAAGTCAGIAWKAPVLIGFQQASVPDQQLAYDAPPLQPNLVHQAALSLPAKVTPQQRALPRPVEVASTKHKPLDRIASSKHFLKPGTVEALNAGLKLPRRARAVANPVSSETLVVLVSSRVPGTPIFTVQMWQITVMRNASKPDFLPRKSI